MSDELFLGVSIIKEKKLSWRVMCYCLVSSLEKALFPSKLCRDI